MPNQARRIVGEVLGLVCWLAASAPAPSAAGEWPPAKFTNSLGMVFVRIPAGEFRMGSTEEEVRAVVARFPIVRERSLANERPAHKVRLTHAFLMGKYEVTVGQFRKFVEATGYKTDAEKNIGTYPGSMVREARMARFRRGVSWRKPYFNQNENHPVVCVSWNDAHAFVTWLNADHKGIPEGWTYRLPTEAEWEYAARGPKSLVYPWGNAWDGTRCNFADRQAAFAIGDNTVDDGFARTAPVGSYSPKGDSPFGVCDMAGNVSEWCQNWYYRYGKGNQTDPPGPGAGTDRVLRGGCWSYNARFCRGANRSECWPTFRGHDLGFRVVLACRYRKGSF